MTGRVPAGPGSCRTGEAAEASSSLRDGDPSRNGLRHYPRRHWSGEMHIVDREFDFVRCSLAYDYRFTSNSQQWREAEAICRALEGPMAAQGVHVITASGIDARSDETRSGSAEGESPVGAAETHIPTPEA